MNQLLLLDLDHKFWSVGTNGQLHRTLVQVQIEKVWEQAESYYERMKTFLEKNPDKIAPWSGE